MLLYYREVYRFTFDNTRPFNESLTDIRPTTLISIFEKKILPDGNTHVFNRVLFNLITKNN